MNENLYTECNCLSYGESTVKHHHHHWSSLANQRTLHICCYKDVCVCAFTHLILNFVLPVRGPQRVSELLLLHAVEEEQEHWVCLSVLGVGESKGGVGGLLALTNAQQTFCATCANSISCC